MVLKPVYMFFGIPLAQLAFDYVQDFYSNKEAVSKIIKKFSLLTFKTDTQKLLQNGDSGVEDRIATMAKYRDNDSVFIVDINEEDVAQINTPLTGLKEIWYAT
jgi:iron uptake system EfeUOB component EfeO/EfeM